MKSLIAVAFFCTCIILAAAYGKSGSANWNAYPLLPMPRPLPPPPPPPMPIVQEIYPVIPIIPAPQPLPVPQPLIFQQFGFQGDFMHHNFGHKYGHGMQMPLHRIVPMTGFGSGIGGGFRTGFMQDPWCDLGVFDREIPFYNDGFQGFQQRIVNSNLGGVVRRNEFAQKFQPQPAFQLSSVRTCPEINNGWPRPLTPIVTPIYPDRKYRFYLKRSYFSKFMPKFPVGPKDAGGLPVNPNLS